MYILFVLYISCFKLYKIIESNVFSILFSLYVALYLKLLFLNYGKELCHDFSIKPKLMKYFLIVDYNIPNRKEIYK